MPEIFTREVANLRRTGRNRFTVKDAIMLAYSNPDFMEQLILEPEQFAETFGFSQGAIVGLKSVDIQAATELARLVSDPVGFAEAIELINQVTIVSAAAHE